MGEQAAVRKKMESNADELFVPSDRLEKHMRDLVDLISKRAYERFESRGRVHGHDWEDWFVAESALLHAVNHEVSDSGDAFHAVIDIAAYRPEDLKMSAEPKRLRIYGRRAGERSGAELSGQPTTHLRALRICYEFPAPINPAKVSAEIRSGLLEVRLPKVRPADEGSERQFAELRNLAKESMDLCSAS
jgi:HSP20 family molecular chaperone IbpA